MFRWYVALERAWSQVNCDGPGDDRIIILNLNKKFGVNLLAG